MHAAAIEAPLSVFASSHIAHRLLRRVLLNKCQEEFEAGDSAMTAVDAREKAAAEKKASGEVCSVAAAPLQGGRNNSTGQRLGSARLRNLT